MAPSNGVARPRSKQPVKPVVPLPYVKRHASAGSTAPSPPTAASLDQGIGLVSGGGTNNGNDLSPADDAASELPSPKPVDLSESPPVVLDGPRREAADVGLAKAPEGAFSPSPTLFHQTLPPFAPSSRPMPAMVNGEWPYGPAPYPHNGPDPMHHYARPSNGSIHFGTLHDSQGSSPAPPHSAGIAPPPGIGGLDGRPAYMVPTPNGFPPMLSYGGDMVPAANIDNCCHAAANFGPMDSFPPYGANYGPSTPHSFHGSQSSGHPDDVGMYGHFPPGPHRNGGPVLGDDMHHSNVQRRILGPVDHPRMLHGMPPPPPMPPGDLADGLIGYLQQQFASSEFADCTLELRYTDQRAPPLRIPGHRLVLRRSHELASRLQKSALKAGPATVVLESGGRWMRSDAFYMAVQRLYGQPLLPIPPHGRADSGDVMDAGSAKDQLDFCLSYAAAGRLLGWAPVTRRGCEVAMPLLGWQTLETVMEFILDGFVDMGTHESFKYGDGSQMLLDAVVAFIAHNLLPSFRLDTVIENGQRYGRLPVRLPAPAPAIASVEASSLSMARGPPVQLGMGRRPQHIPHIQFGDLSVSEPETPKTTQTLQPASHAMLSRVLLELPYSRIKMLLESPLGLTNFNRWADSARTLKTVVEEREARRRRTVEAVVDGRIAVSDAVRTALRSPSPQDAGQWSLLGWQEEMLPSASPEGSSLLRKWVPLVEEAQNGSTSEYP
ncbi:hypothetical protein L249_2636 [Ophiocordyceps polyrhachis-furcata BCC 54312]|uniref:Uncharacterized protein n=1 Tax=Ophiocordyceps polyrhachis-furcata BCC 54312 TaxID=1330021 RepID=A0A367LS22_9HYPO|nr:hypothetical protein L249_2636 [Ophiocordyceps polyrhachis-furcata BCC 54312]